MKYPRAERTDPQIRKRDLIDIALWIADTYGYRSVTAESVADAAKLNSHALIHYHFGNMNNLKNEVVKRAIQEHRGVLVFQAWACGNHLAQDLKVINESGGIHIKLPGRGKV